MSAPERQMLHVGIVGLGSVGCALARALRAVDDESMTVHVSGIDVDDDRVRGSLGQGFIERSGLDPSCNVVFLCVPPSQTPEAAEAAHEYLNGPALLVSCSSVQSAVHDDLLTRARQLGHEGMCAHPMARDELRGALWSITADDHRVTRLIDAMGGSVIVASASEHDQMVALTSHLPQLLAQELSHLASQQFPQQLIAGPGWERAVGRAHEQPQLWDEIFQSSVHLPSQLRKLAMALLMRAEALERSPIQARLHMLQLQRQLRTRRKDSPGS